MFSKLLKLMLLPLLLFASSVWAVDIQISTFEDIDTTVPRGGEVRYNIEFTNSEEDTAENVVVEFFIPETTNFVSSTSSCQVQAYLDAGKSRNKLRCEMGSIRGRTSGSLQITIITTAATGLTIEPSVRISADNEDPSKLLNNEETQNTSIVAGVDLAVTTLTSDPSDVYLNQTYQYRVQVKNNGPNDAANVVLKHTLPSFAQWSSGSSQTSGWSCSRTNQVITCTRGALSSGQSASLSFASSVTQLGSGVVTASSAISSDTAELDSSNNSKTVNTKLKEHADLAVSVATKIPGYWGIDPNTAHSYEITVRNLGPSRALKPIMTFTLKDGVIFQSVTPATGWSCNRSGQQVSCSATSLDINDSDVMIVRALSPQVKGQYVSTAKIATDSNGGSVDLNSRNNLANGTINVVIPQTLSVSKTIDGGRSSFVSGEQFTFKIAVTNSGDTKELVSLEDTLPNQVALISPLSSAVTSDDFNCSVSGQKVTCLPKVASIAKDQTKQVQLTVRAVSVGNSITNTATVTPNTGDAATGSVSFNVASSAAKLVLQKTANLAWNNKNYMGQTFNYYLQVENTGAGAASNVALQDTLSDGYIPVSFISQRNVNGTWQTSSDWVCSIASSTLNCTTSSIAAYTKTRVVLTVRAPYNNQLPRNTFSVGYGGNNFQTSYTGWGFQPINPVKLSVSKTKRAKDTKNTKLVAKGALIESIIKVKNNGEGATQGTLTLEDALKDGEQYVSASGSNWSCTHRDPLANGTGGIVSCVFSNKLQAGSQTNKVTITTRAVAEGTLTNIATAKDVGGSEVSAQKTKSITSSQTADLAISKTVDKTSLSAAESELNYTLTVSNLSGSNITGNDIKISSNTGKAAVLITDDFTATFKSKYDSQATAIRFPSTVTSSRGSQFSCQSKETGSFENTKTQILCHLVKNEVFAVGDQVQVPITVARPFVLTNGQVINEASVSSNTHLDLETANNTAQVASNVAAKFDVAVTQVSYAQNPVSTGDNAIMTIELANLGASKASGVELVHTFTKPAANTFTFISSRFSRSGQSSVCSFNSAVNRLTCNIGELASNEAQTVVVTVLPKSASNRMDWRLDGTSVISADNMQFDNLSGNNSKSQVLQVNTRTANLKIENNDIDDPLGWYPSPRGFPDSLDNIVVYKVDLEYLTDNDGNTSVASGVGYDFQVTPKGVNQTLKFLCDSGANNTCSVSQARCSKTGQSFTGQTTFNCQGPENSSDSSLEEYELRENTAGNNAIYTRYMFFEVISRPSTTGEVAETLATIFSNEKDNVSANNSEAEKTSIRVAVDLSLTKEASVPQVAVGSEFEYIIKVSNAGPGDSAGNVVYDYLPTYLSLNGAVSTSKGVCTASRATAPSSSQVTDFIRCDIDLIAMNETPIEIRVPVKLNSMPSGEQVVNEAWIETKGFDTNKTNNRNSATTPVVKGIISGKVFFDLQNDGVFSSTTDSGLANIQILLNGNLDAGGSITQKSVMTNGSGEFSFTDLAPGTYTLTQPIQTALNQYLDGKDSRSGEVLTNSENSDLISNIRLTAGSSSLNHTFAERGAASVSGYVWVDENDNGFKEAAETSGIENVTLTLTGTDIHSKGVTLTTQTNAQGFYLIDDFTGGNYRLTQTQPSEYNDGLESEDGAVIENTRGTDVIQLGTVTNKAKLENRNFAELLKVQPASLSGRVFVDANENNVFDGAEAGIQNIVIQLTGTDHTGATVDKRETTAADGTYRFSDIQPSNTSGYTLTQLSQDILVANYEDGAESIASSVVAQPRAGDSLSVNLASGQTLLEYNFAELTLSKEGIISGYVYIDSNDDGIKASEELPLENVQFTLSGTTISGKTISNVQVVSNASGRFEFTGLEPSNSDGYKVTQTPPQNYVDGLERFNRTEVAGSRSTDEITKITLTRKQTREDLYFAELIPPTNKKIVAKVLLDINQNGTFNGEDTWLQGVNVTLTGTNVFGQQLNITRATDQNGVVEFTELHPAKVAAQYTLIQAVIAEYADGKDYLNSIEVADHSVDKVVITTLNSTPTILFTEKPKIGDRQVSGRVFLDTLQDGELETAELDKVLENITVTLIGKDKFGREVSLTRTTDINGQYEFAGLTEANADGYSVAATFSGKTENENGKDYLIIGANRTESNTANSIVKVDLTGANKSATVDFTEELKPVNYQVSGRVFLDTLQDGELEAVELDKALENITVTLTGKDKFGREVSLTRTTDINGQYEFADLTEANADGYSVAATFSGKTENENGKDYLIIGANRTESNTANSIVKVDLTGANKSATVDFTEKLKPVSYEVSGRVFLDTLQDGELETVELDEAIKDIAVTLTGQDIFGRAVSLTRTTDMNGLYAFDNLVEANADGYTVSAAFSGNALNENGQDYLNIGATRTESDTANSIVKVDLTGANKSAIVDFTEKLKPVNYEVSGRVFLDTLQDGELETTELDKALDNITVTLTGKDKFGRAVSLTRTTDVNGQYTFADLTEANADGYSVTATQSGLTNHQDGKDYLIVGASRTGSQTANNTVVVDLTANTRSAIVDFTELLGTIPYSISGRVFLDTLQDGELEAAELDKALENITVTLTGKDKFGRTVSLTRTTDTNGQYAFADLTEANADGYSVTATQSGLTNHQDGKEYLIVGASRTGSQTANNTVVVDLTANTRSAIVDFTEQLGAIAYSISGRVFLDTLQDGELETAELDKALENITVTLTGKDKFGRAVSLTRTTDVNGQYTFADLTEANADGYSVTATQSGLTNHQDGKEYLIVGASRTGSQTANNTVVVDLTANTRSAIVDFTEQLGAIAYSISGRVFLDTLQDGELETAELDKALENITVTLTGKDKFGRAVSLTRTTDVNGQYTFADLTEANADGYSVTATQSGLTNHQDGKDYLIVGASRTGSQTANNTVVVDFTANTRSAIVDFTEQLGAIAYSISGRVFLDTLQDGEFETAELDKALENITVTLTGKDKFGRAVSLTRTTDVNGQYTFADLTEANADGYSVTATQSGLTNHQDGKDYLIVGASRTGSQTANNTVVVDLTANTRSAIVDFTEQLGAIAYSISGRVFLDTLQDGELETAELDKALENISVTLTGKDKFGRAVSLTRTTDTNGQYAFADLTEANADGYSVTATQSGLTNHQDGKEYLIVGASRTGSQTANNTVVVDFTANTRSAIVDFTEQLGAIAYSISGRVFLDTLQDGELETAELDKALENISVTLTGKDKFGRAVSLTRTTDVNGLYEFDNLVEANADGYVVSAAFSGNALNENGQDYLIIGANRTESNTVNSSVKVDLTGANKSATVDFTEKLKPVNYEVSGRVFLDTLQDSELEVAELDKALENITVTLNGKDKFGRDVLLTRTTDVNGQYAFTDLTEANDDGYSVAATFSGNTENENGKDYLIIGANRTESNTVNSSVKVDLTGANKSATVDFTEKLKPVDYEVSGRVFLDTLQDGKLETAELDEAIKDIVITLTGQDIFGRAVSLTRTTDVNGQYAFTDLTEANTDGYSVTATQSGLTNHLDGKDYLVVGANRIGSQASSNTVVIDLTAGTRLVTVDFTEQLEPENRSISGRVFLDTLQDGELEVAELDKALESITITLTGKDTFGRTVSHTQATKVDGTYSFTGLTAANDAGYTVTAAQSGISKQLNGQDYLILGAAKTASNTANNSVIVALSGNTETAGVDFTEMLTDEERRITGRVFLDTQQDGELEAAELDKALENITVTLTGNDIFGRSVSRTQTTQTDGIYTFTGLTAANDAGYKLQASSGGYVNGKDYLTTSGVTTISDMSDNAVLVKLSGSNEQATVDFTELPKAGEGQITGRVFFDAQQDGELEAAELDKPLSAVSISLVGTDIYGRTVTFQTQTNELGQFNFTNLTAANDAGYTVTAGYGGFSNGLDYLTIARSTTQLDAENNAIAVKLTETTLTANIDFTEQPDDGTKTIRGSVFVDTEQDGQFEAAKGDSALTQVMVTLAGRDQYGREVNQTAQTDAQGGFEFTRLHEADSTGYVITHALVSPYRDGFDYQDGARTAKQPDTEHTHGIRFESQETVVYDMTERLPANEGVISGQLIVDINQNGRLEEQDIVITDAQITLTGIDLLARDVSLSVQTDAQGRFEFTQLFASNNQGYQLAHQQVTPYLDGLDYLDSKQVDSTDDVIANIAVTAASRTSLLLTEQLPENTAKISGRVFVDIAQNGVFEAQDVVLPQVTLQLSGQNVLGQSISLTTQTDEQGDFSFEQLYASDAAGYQVNQVQPAQYIDGADYLNTQRISEQNDLISDLVLNAGQQQTSLIFTEQFNELGSIAAQVYLDADQNGVPSDTELGLPAVTVTLVGTDIYGREVSLEQPTNEQGIVKFEGLAASDMQGYVLIQSQPEGYFDGKESDQGVVLAENNDQFSITLAPEQQRTGLAFAELEAGSIAGHVYVDSDNSGTFANDADRAIAYVTLTLKGNDLFGQSLERQVQTDIDGAYQFTGLPPSDGNGYQVSQAQPEFYLDGLDYIAGVVVENSAQTDVIYVGVLKSAQQINNIDFTEAYGLAVMGYVFVDKQDQGVLTLADDMSEIAIANSEITLTGYDYRGQSVEMTTTTDENGQYRFEKLAPSDEQGYAISQTTQPSDYIDGSESLNEEVFANSKGRDDIFTVELKELQTFGMYNFAELPRASLAGAVYVDSNEDGVLNDSEQLRVGNVEITLEGTTLEGEAVNLTVRTDEQGEYLFDYLRPGQYSITQTQPSAWLDGEEQLGSLGGEVGQDTFTNINLELGVKGAGYYFAERGSHLSGTVYVDLNDNGTQENNELGLANTQLVISGTDLDGQPVQREVLTDGYGRYQFKQLPLSGGEGFTITETQPENTQDGLDSIGSIGGVQEQNDELKHIQISEHVTHGVDYNFGEQLMDPASISGLVWLDKNHNRAKDDNNGQSGWIVELLLDPQTGEANPLDEEPLATTTSDENGRYTFAGLPVGIYEIRFRHPQGGVIYGTPVTDDPDASSEKGTILNLRLSAGEEVDNQSLPIDPSGVVYNAQTRKPIQGAIVKIIGPAGFEPDLHLVGGSANVEQTTAEDGFYQFLFFSQAPTGIYRLEVTEPVGYLAGGSTQIPVCENTLTAGASELPILVHFEELVPQLDAPIHDPSACVAHSDQITQNNTSTQYYQSFYIDPTLPSGNVVNNHIPLDPYGDDMVQVSKTALKQDVVIGELVPYQISYKNRSSETLAPLSLIDQLPAGLKYVPGSARVDGFTKEPEVLGRVLRWHSYRLAPEQVINIELMVVVGSGVSQGTYINQAWSEFIGGQHSLDSGWRISNIATAAVRVIPDPVFDCSDLSGKVFNDLNRNGYQDGDEKGLPAVRLATAQGLWITTDEHGRYHLACADIPNAVRGSNFIVKVDERSLPSGVRIVSENPRVVRLTRGKSQQVDFAANIHRVARIQLTPSAFVENQLADDYETRLLALLDALDTRPTVIRVAYQAKPSLQTDQQLNNLKHWLSEQAELRELQLTIETEMTPVAIPTLSSLTKETSHD